MKPAMAPAELPCISGSTTSFPQRRERPRPRPNLLTAVREDRSAEAVVHRAGEKLRHQWSYMPPSPPIQEAGMPASQRWWDAAQSRQSCAETVRSRMQAPNMLQRTLAVSSAFPGYQIGDDAPRHAGWPAARSGRMFACSHVRKLGIPVEGRWCASISGKLVERHELLAVRSPTGAKRRPWAVTDCTCQSKGWRGEDNAVRTHSSPGADCPGWPGRSD